MLSGAESVRDVIGEACLAQRAVFPLALVPSK